MSNKKTDYMYVYIYTYIYIHVMEYCLIRQREEAPAYDATWITLNTSG